MQNNPYLPQKAEILEIIQETSSDLDIKTYKLKFVNNGKMDFLPGQFVELSIPGVGEATFGFASSPLEKEFIELSIKRVGVVTEAIHNLSPGACVWLRGPFGNTFPSKEIENSKILVIAGGLGLAPLRPLILYMLAAENRAKYPDIQMLIAARSSGDFVFKREYAGWAKLAGVRMMLTIDRPEESWGGKVGFPHDLVAGMEVDIAHTYAVICGPPIVIKLVSGKLGELGLPKEKILTTLEMRMTCGIGKCGRCNIGRQYVCIDGPVFNMAQLSEMPGEY